MLAALLYFTSLLITTCATAPGALSLSLSVLPLLLYPPSITTRGKVNFPSAYFFFPHPDDSQLCGPDCGSASKDANLFLTSGVKIIKEYLNTQEREARTGVGGGGVYTKLTPLCAS